MKLRFVTLTAAVLIAASIFMNGCSKSPAAEVPAVEAEDVQKEDNTLESSAAAFLDAYLLKKGDVKPLCTGTFEAQQTEPSEDTEEMLLNTVGVTKEDISEETYTAVKALADKLKDTSVITYSIESATESAGIGTVLATVERHDYSALKNNIEELVNDASDAYLDKNMEAMKTLYKEKGEDALNDALYNGITQSAILELESHMKDVPSIYDAMMLTFVKLDGNWLADNIVMAN